MLEKVKPKFKELYRIDINSIYLWFILDNDNLENCDTCKYLEEEKIKFVFIQLKKNAYLRKEILIKYAI